MARSDKKIRVNPSFTQEEHEKLDKLAVACGLTKTEMARQLVQLCLNSPQIIEHIQKHHSATSRFRIIPAVNGTKINYVYAEKKQK